MRFNRIEIPSYGPFTNYSAEFPRGDRDFHLVYGPNEAGKSSLLRAMKAMLFGIPARTTDNFQHEYNQLRIRAELEDASGNARVFQRRKGNRETLLNEAGTAIPESELQALLGLVDAEYFDSLFGLGSEELRHGADALLSGQGRLGEALFSASLGGTPVDRVIQALEEEAAGIFAGRAHRKIREAIRKFNEHQLGKKDSLIKPETWEGIEQGLAEQIKRLEALTDRRRSLSSRKDWLDRCQGALPIVGQLAERNRQVEALPELPDLPTTFANQIRSAQTASQEAEREVERQDGERARLQIRMESCALQPEVLAEAAAIDRHHTDLGTYRENKRILAAKTGEAAAKKQAVEAACRDLGISVALDQLEPLRITLPQFNEAEQMAGRTTAALEVSSEAERKVQGIENQLERLQSETAHGDAPQLARLSELIHRAATVETVANGLARREAELEKLGRSLRGLHQQLAGAPEDLDATRNLTVPTRARLEPFRDQIEENRRDTNSLAEEKRKVDESIRQIEAEIERCKRQGEVPSLEDLSESRRHRDHGWDLVMRAWKGSDIEETFVEGKPLEEAYPEAVTSADKVADRLRLEAEAVAQLEEQRTKLKLEVQKSGDLDTRLEGLQKAGVDLDEKWNAAWQPCHLEPESPREMLEWRETWEEFGRQQDQWSDDSRQLGTDRDAVHAVATSLAEALASEPRDFAELLAVARERREALDAARDEESARAGKIRDLEQDLKTTRETVPGLKDALALAQADWAQCCESLSLTTSASPASQVEVLRSRREMFREFDGWQALVQECKGLQKSVESFEEAIQTLAAKLGNTGGTAELQEATLWSTLEAAKKAQAEHDGFEQQIAEIDERLAAARQTLQLEQDRFDELFSQTGLKEVASLETFLSQLEDLWTHRDKTIELRNHLAGLARGESVDDFIGKVQDEDPASLEAELVERVEEIELLEVELETARAARQDWENQRNTMENAHDTAARHEQGAAFAASAMVADAERFVRLRVAISLLRSQIDNFRRQNQGPFMEKASHWFAEVTGGAFRGIGPSYSDGDDPVIAGLRAEFDSGNGEVPVSGMSEGTRDQLYLALRLAGLELHLQDHEPMPMILDDLLVQFDDNRATNALKALSHLGQTSQVLLFTHHAHLVELARAGLGADSFHLLEIG